MRTQGRSPPPNMCCLPLTFVQPESKSPEAETHDGVPELDVFNLIWKWFVRTSDQKTPSWTHCTTLLDVMNFPVGGKKVVVSKHLLPISSMNLTVFVPKMATAQGCSSICSQVDPAIIQARTLRHRREAFDLLMSLGMARAKWVSFSCTVHVFSVAKEKMALSTIVPSHC